jgi:protein-S-isoprenylcysteine O-methyltransferase Ste14
MLNIALRLLADAGIVAMLLFTSAGTLTWHRAWVLLAVLLLVRGLGAFAVYRVNPELVRERAGLPWHAQQPLADRLLLFAVLATGFVGLPVLAALDVFRFHLMTRPAPLLSAAGLALFAFGWTLKNLALRANAFATAVVRVQHERAHAVADSGVYAVVRHPFYAADPLIFVGLGLWLQSYAAVVAAAVPIALMMIRLQLEERYLRRELPGYVAYAERVRYRLVPGVW